MRKFLAASLILAALVSGHAYAFSIGQLGAIYGHLGSSGGSPPVVVASCGSPTAPDGNIDLSTCSNIYYIALIF